MSRHTSGVRLRSSRSSARRPDAPVRLRTSWLALALLALPLLIPGETPAAAESNQGRYQEFGDAGGFLNILPPGQDGVLNSTEALQAQGGQYPPHVRDQLNMYGDLVYNTPGLTEDRLLEFFKDASFGVLEGDIDRVYSPTANVVVVRDQSFGVPHIFGQTRYATMFAQGYATAEDRLFLMDVLRHVGRGRLSEFLGASEGNLEFDRDQVAVAPYKEQDYTDQLVAGQATPEGQAIYADLLAYTAGVNQYISEALSDPSKMPAEYPALQRTPDPWIPEDTVAIASLVGGVFGRGGGGELTNFCGLKTMTATLGNAADVRAIFDDLHFANDPEAPTSSRDPAPYMTNLGAADPAAHPDIDCASLQPIDPDFTSLQDVLDAISEGPSGFTGAQSNAVLISAAHTDNGRPIAIFGPQTAYFIPQLLVEKDVHGPGIHARGAAFAGTDFYVQLGRGPDYAWSATSSGADNIDQFVLLLCEPGGGTPTTSSMGYLRDSVCEPIETFDHVQIAKPSAGGFPPECPPPPESCEPIVITWRVERTAHYGPLAARGTLQDGMTPIAIASLRTTYRNELGSAPAFYRVNNPAFMTNGFTSFRAAMDAVQYTFNWFYVDHFDIGYQHACRCPQRAQGDDPYLPTWGTGQWDWQSFISQGQQPFDLNPTEGWITSWNNKQAPLFMANDREYSYGPTYRNQLLDTRTTAAVGGGNPSRADAVDIMEDAGTVDLRGQEVLPLLLAALGPTAPGSADPRAQEMRDRLTAWAAAGAHRRDHNADGQYDDAQAPAIMDAWWPRLAHAMFDATSGNAIAALRLGLDDTNRTLHRGSAWQDGFFGQAQRDLRAVLGQPPGGPWSRTYCGGGVLATCRDALWASLSQAAADLEAEFSDPDVADWRRAMSSEDVRHTAVGVTGVNAIHWINRPTFQQLVQIGNDSDRDGCMDVRELGSDPTQGGLRDPGNFWDYGDMPDPNSSPRRDNRIRIGDIFAVVNRYFTDDAGGTAAINRNTDPLSKPPKTGYHPAYDRGVIIGPNRWNLGPANGQIRVDDILAVLVQYFHDCA